MNSDIHRPAKKNDPPQKKERKKERKQHAHSDSHMKQVMSLPPCMYKLGLITRTLFVLTLMSQNFSLFEKLIDRIEVQKNYKIISSRHRH